MKTAGMVTITIVNATLGWWRRRRGRKSASDATVRWKSTEASGSCVDAGGEHWRIALAARGGQGFAPFSSGPSWRRRFRGFGARSTPGTPGGGGSLKQGRIHESGPV